MLTETDDEECPFCGFEHMWLRYGSDGYFQFKACPKCGSGYGTYYEDNQIKECFANEVWGKIKEAYKKTRQEILASYKGDDV